MTHVPIFLQLDKSVVQFRSHRFPRPWHLEAWTAPDHHLEADTHHVELDDVKHSLESIRTISFILRNAERDTHTLLPLVKSSRHVVRSSDFIVSDRARLQVFRIAGSESA